MGQRAQSWLPKRGPLRMLQPSSTQKGNNEFAAQQAQHTPVYYLPLALATKVVDKVTDLDPLVDTYRVAA